MHHAYLYYGSLSLLPELASAARAQFRFEGEHNPDVRVVEYEKFGIDEARELRDKAALRSISGRALVVLGVSSITSEAQQALLKLFEEPQAGAIFVLLAPHGAIIPTLRSRMMLYPKQGSTLLAARLNLDVDVKKFLTAPYKVRSEAITKMLNPPAGGDEGVKERIRDFLNELEKALYSNKLSRLNLDIRQGLEDVAKVRSYVADRSPSFKMLLEHLAVTLPRFDLKTGLSKVEP
jgi:hypothetical protein